MSRWEFMRQLEELLSGISPGEREEALQYYNDYFNDAGRENEQEVIKALGSPAQVARIVKNGLSENGVSGEFTESGYKDAGTFSENPIAKRQGNNTFTGNSDSQGKAKGNGRQWDNAAGDGEGWNKTAGSANDWGKESANSDEGGKGSGTYTESGAYSWQGKEGAGWQGKKGAMPTWAIVIIVIACIFLFPLLIKVAGAIIGAGFGLAASVIGVVLGTGLAAVVLFFVGIMLVIAGFGCMFAHPMAGIGLLGGGCICVALGILFMLLTGFFAGKCIPAICRGIAHIYKKISGKRKGAVA